MQQSPLSLLCALIASLLVAVPTTLRAQVPFLVIEEPAGVNIPHGGTVSYGNVAWGTALENCPVKTFTLRNTGSGDLTGVGRNMVFGPTSLDFRLETNLTSTIPAGESRSLNVRFVPGGAGLRSGVLRVFSNELDDLNITLTGTGTVPQMTLRRWVNGTVIPEGGHFTVGSAALTGATSSTRISIFNDGLAALSPITASIIGTHASEFSVGTQLPLSVAPGSSTSLDVIFDPAGTGTRTAILVIESNSFPSPFYVHLYGSTPPPAGFLVHAPDDMLILPNSTYHFGGVALGATVTRNITFKNTGTNALTITGIERSGTHATEFAPSMDVAAQQIPDRGSLVWPLQFTPGALGSRTATFRFYVSDGVFGEAIDYHVAGTGENATLIIEQPAGSPLAFGQGCDFGTVSTTPQELTFTVKNSRRVAFPLQAAIAGTHSSDFAVTQAPASPLAADASTTLKVRFSPKGHGARQASLRLTHGGNLPSPYLIPLTGFGDVSAVSFDASVFYADQGDTSAVITLTRDVASGPASVRFRAMGDVTAVAPLQQAVADLDFDGTNTQTVNFAIGQATQTVNLTLLPRATMARKNLQLVATLDFHEPGTLLGLSSAKIRILGQDSLKPALALTTPAAGKVVGPLEYLVTGTVGDANGIRRLEMRLNGGKPFSPQLPAVPTTKAVPFLAQITPLQGANTLVVSAWDLQENVTTVTRSFTFSSRHTLYVEFKDMATGLSTPANATLAFTATPATGATTFASVNTTDPFQRRTTVVAGTRVKIVATPKTGHTVDHWGRGVLDGDPGGLQTPVHSAGHIAEFVMPTWDTHIQVWTTTGTFTPPARTTTTLNWILKPDPQVTPSAGLFASLNGTITSPGSFSGKLLVAGQSIPVVALVNGTGPASFVVAGQVQPSLAFPGGELLMRGAASGPPQAALRFPVIGLSPWTVGRPTSFSASRKVFGHYLGPNGTSAYHTFSLTPTGEHNPLPSASPYPRAPGYGTLTLTSVGQATIAGFLADGTSFTTSMPLVDGDILPHFTDVPVAPLFIQLPTPGATTKTALLIGDLSPCAALLDVPYLVGGAQWYRPATTNPKVVHYPQGWPQGFDLSAAGSLYRGSVPLQDTFDTPYTAGQPNLILTLSGGGLANDVVKTQLAIHKNTLIKLPPADASFTLSIAQATGLVTGTFTPNWPNPATAKTVFKGVLIYDDPAVGFFINNAKTPPADGDGTGAFELMTTSEAQPD